MASSLATSGSRASGQRIENFSCSTQRSFTLCTRAHRNRQPPSPAAGGVADGARFVYPFNYGLVSCAAHDYALPPLCNGSTVAQVEWCAKSWCYVDESCDAEKFESGFPARGTPTLRAGSDATFVIVGAPIR